MSIFLYLINKLMIEKIECSAGLRAGKYSHKNYLKVNIYYFKIIPFRAGKSYD